MERLVTGAGMFFVYGQIEMDCLRRRDRRMREAIDRIGFIRREVDDDLFASVVHSIAGQQISMKAQAAVWRRIQDMAGAMDAEHVLALQPERLRTAGLSLRKAECIREFAAKVRSGEFSMERLAALDDEQAIRRLTALRGVGAWTAEMVLLFGLRRPDVFSFNDFGIRRGLQILYHHREIDRTRFERYRRRFSPYGSIASFYLWEVAASAKNTGTA